MNMIHLNWMINGACIVSGVHKAFVFLCQPQRLGLFHNPTTYLLTTQETWQPCYGRICLWRKLGKDEKQGGHFGLRENPHCRSYALTEAILLTRFIYLFANCGNRNRTPHYTRP